MDIGTYSSGFYILKKVFSNIEEQKSNSIEE